MAALESSLCQLNWLIARNNQQSVDDPETPTRLLFQSSDKPTFSYSMLIRMAIDNSPNKKCTLNEIYTYICDSFPYYKKLKNTSWKVNN